MEPGFNSADKGTLFHSLVKELTESERLGLLNKLGNIDNDIKSDKSENFQKTKERERKELQTFSRVTFNHYNFIVKFFVYIKAFFENTNIDDVVVQNELKRNAQDLKINCSKYINISERKIKPQIMEYIKELIKNVTILKDMFSPYIENKLNYYEFITYYFEKNKSDDIKNSYNLLYPVDFDESIDILEKNNYIEEKNKRIKKYFNDINSLNINNLNIEIRKFEKYVRVLTFNYDDLLKYFNITDINQPYNDLDPQYITDGFISTFDRMYRILKSIDFDFNNLGIFDDFLEFNKLFPQIDSILIANDDISLIKDIVYLTFENIKTIMDIIPFDKIFKYLYKSIIYSASPFEVGYNILELYKSYKRTMIDKLWENSYYSLKTENIKIYITDLFDGTDYDTFNYFSRDLKNKLERYSGFTVKDYNSINLIGFFLNSHYHEKIMPVVNKLLIDGSFIKEMVKSNLSSTYYLLKSGYDKILLYDLEFKEDSPLKKKINNSIIRISSDSNFKSILVNVVHDINEELQRLKIEIIEAFKVMNSVFMSLSNKDVPQRIIANFEDIKMPHYSTSLEGVIKSSEYIEKMLNIIRLFDETY